MPATAASAFRLTGISAEIRPGVGSLRPLDAITANLVVRHKPSAPPRCRVSRRRSFRQFAGGNRRPEEDILRISTNYYTDIFLCILKTPFRSLQEFPDPGCDASDRGGGLFLVRSPDLRIPG